MTTRAVLFASPTLAEHLVRGVVGIGAVAIAVTIGSTHVVGSLALGVVAMLALRGCPVCWTTGLIGMICARWRRE